MLFSEYYTQFFTATILEWKHLLKKDKYKEIIIDSLRFMVKDKRIKVYAFVIMPNHIHLIWHIQWGHKREDVQRDLLKYTAQQIKFDLLENDPSFLQQFEVNVKDRQYQFWERNALSIDLYTHKVFMQKFNYIHNNPIQEKWKLSSLPEEYKYSSAGFYESGVDNFGFISHFRE